MTLLSSKSVEKDVVIIGGGPAGMAASIWCSDLGLSNIVLKKDGSTGGQLRKIFQPVRNYPGIREIDPRKLADEFAEQAKALGGDLRIDSSAASIDPEALRVELASGEGIVCEFQGQGRILIQTRNTGALVDWMQKFWLHYRQPEIEGFYSE